MCKLLYQIDNTFIQPHNRNAIFEHIYTMCFHFKSSETMLWRHHNIYVSLYWKYLRLAISLMLQIKDSFSFFLSQNNLDIDLTYTTHNLNNFNKYPSVTFSYIQEYLGYQSNNLYFLFSHSWPSGSVQFWSGSTYQSGWEKNKMFSKDNCGDIAFLWTALFIYMLYPLFSEPRDRGWRLAE